MLLVVVCIVRAESSTGKSAGEIVSREKRTRTLHFRKLFFSSEQIEVIASVQTAANVIGTTTVPTYYCVCVESAVNCK